ncbi:octaprenyl diphosphate synthase [Saccharospirillum sp. MSK14-1]|uniref:polyprenyl synthetase family protein n=1 Tax=Saccharospirillum sp. MSK14-1 TaxID=1897632 RepID=UPI000D370E97|nr:polyprenyl synthetase family protein [Saccharospirillum sp. MSK14-1]PTY38904.1 octaprenyl diphosphate synthase [Saccharospirillum sp. MSK14-1]
MDQNAIFTVVADDFAAVNRTILAQLESRVPLVEKIADHIISSGGKRMRPLLTLLSAGLCGGIDDRHHKLATVIEFLHTATLLHDDVVDTSDMRRGKPTANANWGNAPSVLVGDFLYARAFELLVEIGEMSVMNRLAVATRTLAEGEVMQLMNVRNPDVTEAQYMDVIKGKTAILFQAASETGALLSGQNNADCERLATYGLKLGLAFQLIDDVLDYDGDAAKLGKNVGDDLAEGKPTLPLIHAMQKASESEAQLIRRAIRKGGLDDLDAILDIVHRCGAIDYVKAQAHRQVEDALQQLDGFAESPYKTALASLAELAIARDN